MLAQRGDQRMYARLRCDVGFGHDKQIGGIDLAGINIADLRVVCVGGMSDCIYHGYDTVQPQFLINLRVKGNSFRVCDAAGFDDNMVWLWRAVQ